MFPFLNDTGSGGGLQSHGFNPTPAEQMQQMQAQQAHLQNLQRAAMMHPMANAAHSILANNVLFPGDPQSARKWMDQTQEGEVSKQISAMIASTGVMGLGKTGDMLYGIQNAVANSGMRTGIEGVAGGQQFFGSGFLTDQFSLQAMAKMTNDFYSMGRKNFDSRGLDMTDVGHIMNSASSRGVFSGRKMFDMESYTDATIAEDLAKAQEQGDTGMMQALQKTKPGEVRMRLNGQADKIKTFVQDTGDLLGDLRDLYGNLPVEQLLQQAEAVAGMGIEDMGGPQAVKNRINRISGMAQAYGLNPQAVMESTARLNQSIAGQMSETYGMSPDMYRRTSAALGVAGIETMIGARQSGLESANALGDNGIFQRQFSDDYRASVAGQSSLAVMQQEFGAVEALYAADQAGTSEADKKALRASVAQLQNAGTAEEREKARTAIDDAMKKSGWGATGTLMSQYGGDISRMTERMSSGSLDSLANMTRDVDRKSALEYQTNDAMANTRIFERYSGLASLGAYNVEGNFRTLIDNFGAMTLEDIMAEPDVTKRKKLMVNAGMSEGEAAKLASQVGVMQGAGDFNTAFREFEAEFRSNPMNANFVSGEETRAAQDRTYQQLAINNSLGRHRLGQPKMIDVILGGLSGTGQGVTEENVLSYMEQQFTEGDKTMGMMVKRNKDGGLEVTTEEAARMLKTMAPEGDVDALLKQFGYDDVASFAKGVSSREGFQKFHKNVMQDSNLFGNLMGTDGMFVTNKIGLNKTKGAMEGIAATELFKALGLGGIDKELQDRIIEGAGGMELQEQLMNDDLSGFNKKGTAAMDKAIKKGDEHATAAMLFYGSDRVGGRTTILSDLDQRQQGLMEKREGASDKEKVGIDKELTRIREMKEQLGAGPGEGKKYLGVMQVVDADGEPSGTLGVYEN